MTREEMISALRAAGVRAIPTVATYDMGLQYEYITPEGAGTGFGGMGQWPLWKFSAIPVEQWMQIKQSLDDETLSIEGLDGTGLDGLFDAIYTFDKLDPSDVFAELSDIDASAGTFYCLFDAGMMYCERPQFYATQEEAIKAFAGAYCNDVESWDGMDDDELTEWYGKLSDELDAMPFMEVSTDE